MSFMCAPHPSLGFDESLVFGSCDRRICVNLTVENDVTLEETESFEVTLQRTPDLDERIILTPATAEISIIDDDGLLMCPHIYTNC